MSQDLGCYEPLQVATERNDHNRKAPEPIGLRPMTPQRSPRRSSSSPLSRTAVASPQVPYNSSRLSLALDSRLQHDFDSHKQFREIFWRGFQRFLLTAVLSILLFITIWQFARRRVISNKWKKWFNALNLGLSMALGMSVQHGFKGMAIEMRWWILSQRRRSLSEVDKILRCDSLAVVGELLATNLWHNPLRRWRMILVCSSWLLLNLLAQVMIPLMGLNYGPGVDEDFALTKPGPVLIPDLNQIYPVGFDSQAQNTIGAQQYTANSFGNMALSFGWGYIEQRPQEGAFWNSNTYYFLSHDSTSWMFVFLDWSHQGDVAVYTNRSVITTSNCQSWPVMSGGNGTASNLTILKDADGGNFNISIPFYGGKNQTTFFTEPDMTCGDGCSIVEALEAGPEMSWYYNCNITVNQVLNGTLPQHDLGLDLRQMASSGIALQGYGLNSSTPSSKQYQLYPSQSTYGQAQGGSADGIGLLIGRFAIGVIAASAIYTNQSIWLIVPGDQPQIGAQMTVQHWQYIWLITAMVISAQGIGFILTAFWANRVRVKDESVLATATLLRPVMYGLGSSGNAADCKEICEVLEDPKMIYTAYQHPEDQKLWHLDLGAHPGLRRARAFEEGVYD